MLTKLVTVVLSGIATDEWCLLGMFLHIIYIAQCYYSKKQSTLVEHFEFAWSWGLEHEVFHQANAVFHPIYAVVGSITLLDCIHFNTFSIAVHP